jgi:hypothetical protein
VRNFPHARFACCAYIVPQHLRNLTIAPAVGGTKDFSGVLERSRRTNWERTGYYLEDGHLSAVAVVPETAFANFATSAAEAWIRSSGSRKRGEPSVFVPLAGSLEKAEAQCGNSSTAASATVTIGSGRMNRHSNAGIRATAHI